MVEESLAVVNVFNFREGSKHFADIGFGELYWLKHGRDELKLFVAGE